MKNNKIITKTFVITKKCNHNCIHCFINHSAEEEISFEQIIEEVEKEKQKLMNVIITGGEPTLHPNFDKIIDYLYNSEKIKYIMLQTNGTNISFRDNEETMKKINSFYISVPTTNKEVYARITNNKNNNALDILFDNIRFLGEIKKDVSLNVVLPIKTTYEYIEKTLNDLLLLPSESIFMSILLSINEKTENEILDLSKIDFEYIIEKLKDKKLLFNGFPKCILPEKANTVKCVFKYANHERISPKEGNIRKIKKYYDCGTTKVFKDQCFKCKMLREDECIGFEKPYDIIFGNETTDKLINRAKGILFE